VECHTDLFIKIVWQQPILASKQYFLERSQQRAAGIHRMLKSGPFHQCNNIQLLYSRSAAYVFGSGVLWGNIGTGGFLKSAHM
jgi:hypothetical protein